MIVHSLGDLLISCDTRKPSLFTHNCVDFRIVVLPSRLFIYICSSVCCHTKIDMALRSIWPSNFVVLPDWCATLRFFCKYTGILPLISDVNCCNSDHVGVSSAHYTDLKEGRGQVAPLASSIKPLLQSWLLPSSANIVSQGAKKTSLASQSLREGAELDAHWFII